MFNPPRRIFDQYDYNTRSELVDAVRYFRPYSVENVGGRFGSAETSVTVTVNTNTATRQDYYWYHRLGVDNLYTAAYPQVVVEAVFDPGTNDPYVVSSETGNVFVAASPEEFSYDDDPSSPFGLCRTSGNLLSDGRFEYTRLPSLKADTTARSPRHSEDGENRLIAVETITGLPEDVPAVHVEFEYDYMSRRTGKNVYSWSTNSESLILTSGSSFLYDGWNLVQEIRNQDSVSTNHYVWRVRVSH